MSPLSERFQDWESSPPSDLFGDPIWKLPAYRIALFLSAVVREDVSVMIRDGAPTHLYSQLDRAVGSIGANIEEGYARFSGRERARYYEIALGSAREARHWYRGTQTWLGRSVAEERGALLTRAIKILTVAIPRERQGESEQRIQRRRSSTKVMVPAPAPASAPAPAPAPAHRTSTSMQQPATSTSPPASSATLHETVDQIHAAETGQRRRFRPGNSL